MSRKLVVLLLSLFLVGVILNGSGEPLLAQELVTSTPVLISIPTLAPPPVEAVSSATPTFTPTVPGRAVLEAKPDAGDVNVRAEADIESERLGTIRAGDQYPVVGKYFRWYQFQFDVLPSGTGWVFDELVNIIGDPTTIRDLSAEALPTDDPTIVAGTATQIALTQTPGGILTATENSRLLPVPGAATAASNLNLEGEGAALLPTFTYPPDMVAIAPTQASGVTPTANPDLISPISVENGVPPIIPILVLGGLGLLGLAVNSMRR